MRNPIALALITAATVACGAPLDFTGTYMGSVTNGVSTCPGSWNQGEMGTVSFVTNQSGANVTMDLQGLGAVYFDFALGSHTFTGTAAGDTVTATVIGSRSQTRGMCTYTTNATIRAELTGNALQGSVTYTPVTNSHPDCTSMMVQTCSAAQSFAATRPPPR